MCVCACVELGSNFIMYTVSTVLQYLCYSMFMLHLQFDMPATVYSVVWLMGDAILFGILAWYLDAVFPGMYVRSCLCMPVY